MRTLAIFITLFSTLVFGGEGSMSSGGQLSSSITMKGEAAAYLYRNVRGLDFTQCFVEHLEGEASRVGCELLVYTVQKVACDQYKLTGLAADELWRKSATLGSNILEENGISCYQETLVDNSKHIACSLKGEITASAGVSIESLEN